MTEIMRDLVESWIPRWRTDAPCAVCHGIGDHHRGKLVVCRACHEASRPHHESDPYDELGGGD